ncbi:MAG: Trm112 family protein [Burkholderiaceae bacterium]
MTLDHRLLDLLVCPVCKGPLQPHRDADHQLAELQCPADRLAFPVRDGIPVMLEHEARSLDAQGDAAVGPA